MKKGTKILLFVVLPLLLIACVGTGVFLVAKEISAKNTFTNEINSLSETNMNTDIVSSGNYGKVEGLLKNDFKLYMESANKLVENYKKIEDLKPLNIEVYKADGPDFVETKATVNAIKEENAKINAELKKLISEEEIARKIEENALNTKFSDLYKEVLGNMQLKEGVNKIVEADTKFDEFLNSILKVLDYLIENKDKWFIENDILKSTDKTFIDEYNELIQNTNVEF
ncbi:MAG: hypothetical protein Q4D02_05760 [Clostridia bacterium]|nr:hypothetical protein [Clostridia bacterium]